MIHEVELGRSCDSLREELEKEVLLGVNAQVAADSVIEAQQKQIDFRDEAGRLQTQRVFNLQQANQELKKEIRRQRGLTIATAVVSVITILMLL